MNIYIDNNDEYRFDFDHELVARQVCEAVLEQERCPFDTCISIMITDDEQIRQINADTRGIDNATDVLSFPGLFFDGPGQFDEKNLDPADSTDPETGLVMLGDIVLSYDHICDQAEEYGHSVRREYALLIAHSMLHLCGYDHMEEEDALLMRQHERMVMQKLGITREKSDEQ